MRSKSQKSEHDTACVFLRLSTPSADIIGYGGVCDQEVFLKKVPHVNRPGPVDQVAVHVVCGLGV